MNQCGGCGEFVGGRATMLSSYVVLEWTGFGEEVASARGNRRAEILHVSRRVSG